MDEKIKMKVELNVELVVTQEDMYDIMCGALAGGINYWCDEAEVVGDYLGHYASEQISRGGQLKLYDFEAEEKYILTKEKLLEGIKKYCQEPTRCNIVEQIDGKFVLDCCNADAEVCDAIVQLALFGEVIYG